ncbi:ABC transporter ATP-binding protein [Legionella shakespearei]|uniref:ABC transporter ATP binding transmembrane protein n=1 Tax=Legionella shakespearei DSM 23087 TaxID=1122169 RepID=A0A0W0YVT9_9GAMM|nr:ABC transporter ATP-binding protein [Legionella shakespearei]KTD60815.1 ABC transporter ATP binding transmembrane protein [Legionella shakespearei DSM 23087]
MGFLQWISDKMRRCFRSRETEALLDQENPYPDYSKGLVNMSGEDHLATDIEGEEDIEAALIPPPPLDTQENGISSVRAILQLRHLLFTRANVPRVTIAMILSTVNTGLNFLTPYLFSELINLLTSDDQEADIAGVTFNRTALISTLVSVYTLAQIVPNLRDQLIASTKSRATKELIRRDTEHLLNKSLYSQTTEPFTQQLLLFQRSFFVVDSTIPPLLAQIIPTSLETLAAGILLATQYDLGIGGGVLALMTLYTGYSALTSRPIIKAREKSLTAGNEIYQVFSSALMNYKPMRDFGKFEHTMKGVIEGLNKYAKADTKAAVTPLRISLGHYILSRGSMLAACLYVGMKIKSGRYTVQDFIMLVTYLNQLSISLPAFGRAVNEFVAALPDLKFVYSELAKPDEVVDLYPDIPLPLIADQGPSIEFDDVTFRYPYKAGEAVSQPVLKHMSLRVEPGEKVALVSTSGAGKTTLFNLLYRYFEAETGVIKINEQDISQVSLYGLQDNISLLGQSTNLFKGTIRANICYGAQKPEEFTDEMIWEIARKAGLQGFLESFPAQLDTDVGEAGKALSGGQQQKVAILRGLVKKSPILLLDEITAPLDNQSANDVLFNLCTNMESTTLLMITHKLVEAAQYMDRIIVIDQGRVIATGTHEELLASCALYYSLWQTYQKNSEQSEDSTKEMIRQLSGRSTPAATTGNDEEPIHTRSLYRSKRHSLPVTTTSFRNGEPSSPPM